MYRNYYTLLDVAPSATEDEIKAAYRRLSKKYHPDCSKVADAARHFIKITSAYKCLSTSDRRAQYDAKLAALRARLQRKAFKRDSEDDADTTKTYQAQEASRAGEGVAEGVRKLCATIYITDATLLSSHVIEVRRSEACVACGGTNGRLQQFCNRCGGRGHRESLRQIQVSIPTGVRSGTVLRLRGQGEIKLGSRQREDLYVGVIVAEEESHAPHSAEKEAAHWLVDHFCETGCSDSTTTAQPQPVERNDAGSSIVWRVATAATRNIVAINIVVSGLRASLTSMAFFIKCFWNCKICRCVARTAPRSKARRH